LSRQILEKIQPRELHLIDGWWTVEDLTYQRPYDEISDARPTKQSPNRRNNTLNVASTSATMLKCSKTSRTTT